MGIFDKLFGSRAQDPVNFARQLGNTIDKFSEASDVIKRVAYGLSLCAAGDFRRGHPLLLHDGVRMEATAYTPSGKHAYVYTELLGLGMQATILAMRANKFGIFPTRAQLYWLRDHDLILHDSLVNLRQPVKPLSCVGVFAHYIAEIRAEHAVVEPMVQVAEDAYALEFTANSRRI